MRRSFTLSCLLFLCLSMWANGTIVFFNPGPEDKSAPAYYVDIDDTNMTRLKTARYVEISVPAGSYKLSLYYAADKRGNVYGNYNAAHDWGQSVHLAGIQVANDQTVYVNVQTGKLSSEKDFSRLQSSKKAMQALHPLTK